MKLAALFLALLFLFGTDPAWAFFHGGSTSSPGSLTATVINPVANGNVTSANANNGLNNIPASGYLYFDGTVSTGTTIGAMTTAHTGSPSISYAITGDTHSCYQMSGANLQPASLTGSCAPGLSAESITITASASGFSGTPTATFHVYAGKVYYLSTASGNTSGWGNGSDSNNGTATSTPWLTVNHAANCGDFLLSAKATNYDGGNFNGGWGGGGGQKWGAVTCPGNDNVAWVKCITFDACSFSSFGAEGAMEISAPYWGIQGFECDSTTEVSCFMADPPTSAGGAAATIHHVAFANTVCNNSSSTTGLSCVQTNAFAGGNGPPSVDYIMEIGNLEYNATPATSECGSGSSWAGTGDFDSGAGTHDARFLNIGWANFNGAGCGGTNAGLPIPSYTTDGECHINDSLGDTSPQGQILYEGNICLYNGGVGILLFTRVQPATGHTITALVRNNTSVASIQQAAFAPNTGSELEMNNGADANYAYLISLVTNNLTMPIVGTSAQANAVYAIEPVSVAQTSTVNGNFIYSPYAQNVLNWQSGYNCNPTPNVPNPGGAGQTNTNLCSGNTTGTDPAFAGEVSFTGSITGTTLTRTAGSALVNGLVLFSTGSTAIKQATVTSGCVSNTCTVSVSQTVLSEAIVGLPVPGAPSCSGAADALACESTAIANYRPTASGASAKGAVNSSGVLGNITCDANNTTAYMLNIERALPADMNPCG